MKGGQTGRMFLLRCYDSIRREAGVDSGKRLSFGVARCYKINPAKLLIARNWPKTCGGHHKAWRAFRCNP
jgi:hypothetical protein